MGVEGEAEPPTTPPPQHAAPPTGEVPAAGMETPEAPANRGSRRFSRKDDSSPKFPKRRVANVAEQRVLKIGLSKLGDELTGEAELKEVPGRVLRKSFFNRLLTNEIEFNGAMAGDISAAQSDIKHLALEQQLVLRCRTLDFATESASHDAHNNFLGTLDSQLFEKFARRCLEGHAGATIDAKVLLKLGFKFTLIRGAIQLLEEGSDKVTDDVSEVVPLLPECWAIALDEGDCLECSAVLFHATDVWAQTISKAQPDFVGLTAGEKVAIIRDRSSGTGKSRTLNWDVQILDPKLDDIPAELARSAKKVSSNGLSSELAARLSLRQQSLSPGDDSEGQSSNNLSSELAARLSQRQRSPSPVEVSKGDLPGRSASVSSVQSDRVEGSAKPPAAASSSKSLSWGPAGSSKKYVSFDGGALKNTSEQSKVLATGGGNPWGQHMLKPSGSGSRLPISSGEAAMGRIPMPSAKSPRASPRGTNAASGTAGGANGFFAAVEGDCGSFGANSSFAPDFPSGSPGLCERCCSFASLRPKESRAAEPFLAC